MPLLSDREAFDKAAGRRACIEIFFEVMRGARQNLTTGHWTFTETNREKLSYAIEGAQYKREEMETQNSKARLFAIEAALRIKIQGKGEL